MTDAEIRANPNLVGREAYEASLAAVPNYHDGTPRPSWDALPAFAKWTWTRPVLVAPSCPATTGETP